MIKKKIRKMIFIILIIYKILLTCLPINWEEKAVFVRDVEIKQKYNKKHNIYDTMNKKEEFIKKIAIKATMIQSHLQKNFWGEVFFKW